ncbi:cytochrome c [Zoogloea sp.]|uniref:cytochrome c n=1 Tax=Zoogloea sp. TaxID=49181 RepID=UPI00262591D9|nr:cytochrome c [uncultured Zoogloea sp.]
MKRTRPAALAAFVISIAVLVAVLGGGWVLQRGGPPDGVMQAHAQNAPPPAAAPAAAPQPEVASVDQDAPYREACAREGLNESECVGRLIWFKATGGNERFHTYTFQQRVGVLVDWFRVLRSDQRDDRFWAWGIINDPACCKPGEPDCPAKSTDETFGFDWCPGDDVLLKYVGKPGYVDPACGLKDATLDPDDPHSQGGKVDQRHSACDLRFGTSTGALGIRKFPNPRFDLARWQAVNGGKLDWSGFSRRMDASTGIESDSRVSKLADASVEPPFLIGTSCGSCHIAFDPLNPPADPARPKWENIKGLVGNQYTRMSELLGSGMSKSALEYQMFAHARPGVTDTSAISHDQVNNPGTINALVNVAQRPVFKGESIAKWRKVADCGTEKDDGKCWCEPGRSGKCWAFSTRSDDTTPVNLGGQKVVLPGVHHILKGGEDSTGALEAIQRVYFNIGSCAEQCWVNHFTDMRQVDPQQRGFGQTPFNVGQCRRDCPSFRAVEDRLQNILDFFASAESDQTDLAVARANARRGAAYGRAELVADLEKEFGKGAVARGSKVFGETCARCHSSITEAAGGPFASRDFAAPNEAHPRKVRADFLGNDEATPVTEVGTFPCRALHSNHMAGHLYMEYGSESMRARPPLADLPQKDELKNGGRGYLRNISLVNVWATAPFMHNNAIGPEICGKPANHDNDFHRARYVGADGKLLAEQPACLRYDPSVDGRFELYKRSMHELLNPAARGRKVTFTNADLLIDVGIRPLDGKVEKPLGGFGQVKIPMGASAGFLNGLLHKQLIADLYLAKHDPARLEAAGRKALVPTLQAITEEVLKEPKRFVDILRERRDFLSANYVSCDQLVENEGHRFGEDLSDADKKAVTAFLATL